MLVCGSLVGSIPARVSTIEKMLELDFDRIENEYLYNGPSFRSFHANPAIMLADMRDSMQPLIVRPHNPPTKSLPLQTLNCRHRTAQHRSTARYSNLKLPIHRSTHVLPSHRTSSIPPQNPHIHNHNPHNGTQARMARHPSRPIRQVG
jgi:hypothetical protein